MGKNWTLHGTPNNATKQFPYPCIECVCFLARENQLNYNRKVIIIIIRLCGNVSLCVLFDWVTKIKKIYNGGMMLGKIYDSILGDPSTKPLNSGGSVRKDVIPRSMSLFGMAQRIKKIFVRTILTHTPTKQWPQSHTHTQINIQQSP